MKIKKWEEITQIPIFNAALGVMKIISSIDITSQVLIVGGVVRDILLNDDINSLDISDIDISTNVDISKIEEYFECIDIGKNKDFGIIVVKHNGYIFEVAQYRKDIYNKISGKGADGVEIINSFREDAARRDLTINAMGLTLDGRVIDHFDGLQDIKQCHIDTVGEPDDRFDEDLIRMLRVVRFSVKYNFVIMDRVYKSIKKKAHMIMDVAPERILKELNKIAEMSGEKFANAIELMNDLGLLREILPEVYFLKMYEHNPKFHPEGWFVYDDNGNLVEYSPDKVIAKRGNVYDHTIAALRCNEYVGRVINWSILLHDVGKLNTHTFHETGVVVLVRCHHYKKHQLESPILIDIIADRLKMDNETRDILKFVGLNHMMIHDFLKLKQSKSMELINHKYWTALLQASYCDSKCRGDVFDSKEWLAIEDRVERLRERFKENQSTYYIRKVINGNFVMELRPDIEPSYTLGKIIKDCVDMIINKNVDIEDMVTIKKYIMDWS